MLVLVSFVLVVFFFRLKPEFLTSGRYVGLRETVILYAWFCENKNEILLQVIQNTTLIQSEGKVSLLLSLFPQPEGLTPFGCCQNSLGLSSLFTFLVNNSPVQLQSASADMSLVGKFSVYLCCYSCRVTHVIFENTM